MKNLFTQLPLITLFIAAASSCSSDIEHAERHPMSSKYLKVTGNVGAVSRATANSWEANDKIGIHGGGYDNIEYVTTGGTGTFTAVKSESAIKIEPDATTEFTAYYPYRSTTNIEFPVKVVDDNDFYTSTPSEIDIMFAKSNANNGAINFEFKHMMSNLKLTLVIKYIDENGAAIDKPADMEEITTTDVVISNICNCGSFRYDTGFITTGTSNTGNIKAKISTNGTPLIVPSQDVTSDIVITATFGDKQYKANIRPELKAGYQYSYTLTYNVKIEPEKPTTTTMSISQATIAAWTESDGGDVEFNAPEGAVGGGDPVTPEVGDKVAAVGDYILKDGSILPAADYNKDTHKNQVAAVVFYVAENKNELQELGFPTSNGLAIGLDSYDNKSFASSTGATIKYLGQSQDNSWTPEMRDLWLKSNKDNSETVPTRKAGYANTEMYKYINEHGYYAELANATITPSNNKVNGIIDVLNEANNQSPINSNNVSSWYVPSYAEFLEIEKNLEVLGSSFRKIGSELTYYTGSSTYFVWTSDERNPSQQWGWIVNNPKTYSRSLNTAIYLLAVSF